MNLDDKKKEKTIEVKPVESKPEVSTRSESVEEYNPTGEIKTVKCPECGTEIQMAEGCFICFELWIFRLFIVLLKIKKESFIGLFFIFVIRSFYTSSIALLKGNSFRIFFIFLAATL